MEQCSQYNAEFISRIVDREVSAEAEQEFFDHRAGCETCRNIEADFRQMSRVFQTHTAAQADRIRTTLPPIRHKAPSLIRKAAAAVRPRVRLKLASLATAGIIVAAVLFPWTQGPAPGPSAIVDTVDAYGSSVMIIETQEAHHTIIWFSET